MVEQSRSVGVGERFGTYVEELREFFRSRDVHFGSPADVVAFAERVAEPGPFQDEMGSMVRSIVYQEGDRLGRGELLALVAVAVGGPEVETAAQEMHASVRQIFVFVNSALRQQHRMFAEEPAEKEEVPVTASHILAAPATRNGSEGQAVAGRTPGNGFYAGGSATPGPEPELRRSEPAGSGMLFKAVTMSETEKDQMDEDHDDEPRGVRPWLVPAVVAVAAVLGVGAYVLTSGTRHGAGSQTVGSTFAPMQGTAAAGACVAGLTPGAKRSTVEERSRWAHNLLDQKLYEAALPELRDVARIDPGYPGINLDQSQALLQMKRPEDAREAIDNQINISECLSRLPAPALDAYCSSEFSPSAVSGCRPQLAHIREAAELQAALVHLELGHRAAPDGTPAEGVVAGRGAVASAPSAPAEPRTFASGAVGAPAVRAHRTAPLPPATEGDTAGVSAAQPGTAGRTGASRSASKSNGDDSLRRGEGTDSVFGAYSKPQ